MDGLDFPIIFLHFLIYSFIGWLVESIYVSILQRHWVNRGFLFLPLCPIYGFGGVLFLFFCRPFTQWPAAVFLISAVVASILEYFTSWFLEAVFGIRWWDYRNERLNLKGRVCLKNSIIFGLMGFMATYLVSDAVDDLAARIPENLLQEGTSIAFAIILFDTAWTVASLLQLSEKLRTLQADLKKIEAWSREKAHLDWQNLRASLDRLRDSSEHRPILERIESNLAYRGGGLRLLKAFPDMKTPAFNGNPREYYTMVMDRAAETVPGRIWRSLKDAIVRLFTFIAAWVRDIRADFSLDNLFWVFIIGAVLGYIVETIFFVVVKGELISRQGLVIGPFSPIYGLGAALMAFSLAPVGKRRKTGVLFFSSALIGGVYEFLCSLFLETFMGAQAWDYSNQSMQFGGRTSLLFMFFWGILGTWFVRYVYPKITALIGRIPKRWKRTLSTIMAIFLAFDVLLSVAAIHRWYERDQGQPATSAADTFLDGHYPDSDMEKIFPSMHFIDHSD